MLNYSRVIFVVSPSALKQAIKKQWKKNGCWSPNFMYLSEMVRDTKKGVGPSDVEVWGWCNGRQRFSCFFDFVKIVFINQYRKWHSFSSFPHCCYIAFLHIILGRDSGDFRCFSWKSQMNPLPLVQKFHSKNFEAWHQFAFCPYEIRFQNTKVSSRTHVASDPQPGSFQMMSYHVSGSMPCCSIRCRCSYKLCLVVIGI